VVACRVTSSAVHASWCAGMVCAPGSSEIIPVDATGFIPPALFPFFFS
jgi:hypothetical protein